MTDPTIRIDARFRGPPRSGNGGYAAGCLARHLPGPATVRLKAPPRLDAPLRVEIGNASVRLWDADTLIAEARPAVPLDLPVPPCPPPGETARAAQGFAGFRRHAFPGCFVCGTARAPGDGLRIFPGALGGGGATLAAPWTPDASLADAAGQVAPEHLWAALDCPGAFALPAPGTDRTRVLGELSVTIHAALAPGEACSVLGWPLEAPAASAGRKQLAGTAIYGADGRLVALARAAWIEVPLSTWG